MRNDPRAFSSTLENPGGDDAFPWFAANAA